MTAPAAIIASFVQPAAKLAMGDAVGGAMGGFEALLAMLTQSVQGGTDGQATTGETAPETSTETPAETGNLAGLLGQAGPAAWMAQAMSQVAPKAEDAEAPITCAVPQARTPLVDTAFLASAPETAEATTTEAPATALAETPADAADLQSLLRRHAPEAVDPSVLERAKPVKGQTAAETLQRVLESAPPAARHGLETAIAAQARTDAPVLPTDEAEIVPETPAGRVIVPPPVEAKGAPPSRKAAATDGKVTKLETANAAATPAKVVAAEVEAEPLSDDPAPVEVAAHEAETAEAPAHANDTTLQTLTARLEAVAAGATAFAAQVRGAPETVAKFAAGILDKLEGQSTKFDLQLDPHGLGTVDVSVEIGSDGKLTAQMGFDSQLGLTELRSRAQELRTALEQAGFSLADGALTFDFSGDRRQQTADSQADRSDQAGKAFARALGALDDELAAVPTRYQARRGLDLLI